MQIHKFFILLFLYLAPFNLVAQSPYVQKFSHSAELPRVRINDIMQDHKGYIWLATSKGLYQFNGSEYRLYGKNSNLYHANIAALYLSEKDSSLWITAVDGRTWRKKDDNLIFQSINDGLNKAKGAPIKASIKETDSTLHFYTYELEEFCFANNSLIKKDTVNYLSIAFDLVKKLQPKWQQKIAIFLQLNLVDLYRDERFKQGNIILFSNKQKAVINFGNLNITADNKNIQASYNQDMILDMKAIDGVILKSIYGKGLIIEKPNKAPDTILSRHIITKIFVDQHDGIWIGTLTGSLFYIQNIHVTIFKSPFSDITHINEKLILTDKTGKIYTLTHGKLKTIGQIPVPINYIHQLDANKIAIAGLRNIFLLTLTNGKINVLHKTSLKDDLIYDIAFLNKQIYTIGSKGVYTYYIDSASWGSKCLKNKSFRNIASHNGNIIASNDNGIWEITKEAECHKISNQTSIYLKENHNLLFLISPLKQLSIVNENDEKKVFQLNTESVNHIEKIHNKLLISTNKGVYRTPKLNNQKLLAGAPLREAHGLNILKTINYNDTLYALHKSGILQIPNNKIKNLNRYQLDLYSKHLTQKKPDKFIFNLDKSTDNLNIEINNPNFIGNPGPRLYYRLHNDTTTHMLKSRVLTLAHVKNGTTNVQLSYDPEFKKDKLTYRLVIIREKYLYQKTVIQIAALLLIAGLIVVFVMWRIKTIKRKNTLQNAQIAQMQTVLQQQMNPHFIFNSLTSINHYILQNNAMESSRYLTKFSVLIRNILDNSKKEIIPLAEELETLKIYLDLELLRFKDRFTYTINLAPDIDKNRIMLPPFILQPYVESALRDGIINKPGKGNILLNIRYVKRTIQCTIIDDGIGRPDFPEQHIQKDRFNVKNGTQIAKQRIELYNRLNSRKINIRKEDMIDHEKKPIGTKLILNFPINQK